jgi:hypothetical protein
MQHNEARPYNGPNNSNQVAFVWLLIAVQCQEGLGILLKNTASLCYGAKYLTLASSGVLWRSQEYASRKSSNTCIEPSPRLHTCSGV